MFTRIREKLQAANPRLLFSSYGTVFSDFTRAMNTPETPFIFLDSRHYMNDDRQAWWESYGDVLRKEGYLYIPGGWTNALFGAQASQVSAAQWIYEASINEDGCWLWFERELDDEILRAYATADRRIEGVLERVGDFLFNGKRDPHFVTTVEWTGRPELSQATLHQTYHLGEKNLVHVSNVNTEWPIRVRLRFPRLAEGETWTVRDAMGDVYYTDDGGTAVWTREQLLVGVVVTLDPRSDMFLEVAPKEADVKTSARMIWSRDFNAMPDHATALKDAFEALPVNLAKGRVRPTASQALLYTATEPMGFNGPEGPMTIGNAIRSLDARYKIGPKLAQLRGHLWSPGFSPDGQRIVFVHDAGGRGQICVMNADGTLPENLSANDFCDRDPRWSPDGERIAFMSDRSGDWDIYVMNADGSDQKRLAGNEGLDRAPDWSPDGKRVAWESHVSGMPNIWVVNADGSDSRRLIPADSKLVIQEGNVGKNALYAAARMMVAVREVAARFPGHDDLFSPPFSTMEPTRKEAGVENINTVPGRDVFYIDCRVLPPVALDEVIAAFREVFGAIASEEGVGVELSVVQQLQAPPATAADSPVVKALQKCINRVLDVEAKPAGIGGGTVAAFFRKKGLPAAVWQTAEETAHMPDEWTSLDALVKDSAIFGLLYAGF